jgi:hypothetical protein
MNSARALANGRAVERLRHAMRDVARLKLAEAAVSRAEAEKVAVARAEDLAVALTGWNEVLKRRDPDPAIFGLAGAHVVRSESRHKAAVLDEKIVRQQCEEARAALAQAEARLEGSRMVSQEAKRDYDRSRDEQVAREAEDAFGRRRRA